MRPKILSEAMTNVDLHTLWPSFIVLALASSEKSLTEKSTEKEKETDKNNMSSTFVGRHNKHFVGTNFGLL